ncbi:MAG: hypothetical protein LUQ36_04540 [Methanoregula sp.]|nr:hypothetical protein [Methanoregula sp.]
MERTKNTGRTDHGIPCPLCGQTNVHYRKETATYVCGHCGYRWYTIEHCNL